MPTLGRSKSNEALYKAGIKEGQKLMRNKALSILETKYMNQELDKRDPKAAAILQVARELAEELKSDD